MEEATTQSILRESHIGHSFIDLIFLETLHLFLIKRNIKRAEHWKDNGCNYSRTGLSTSYKKTQPYINTEYRRLSTLLHTQS